jgi:hypothetical protein
LPSNSSCCTKRCRKPQRSVFWRTRPILNAGVIRKEAQALAHALGQKLVIAEAVVESDFDTTFSALERQRVEALLIRSDVLFNEDNASTSIWAPRTLAFTSETFLLSFSLPNFHFHAVTAYDILRARGVPIGKRDYEGQLRTRTA